ncbi:hypothetical protein AAFF_G00417260 [Aldrovandia affinis]|uniref:Uncharacterized protein n=1 Tax=Aldrovandia affinis TaxID=143900 RepID=A0AAD7R3K0_9TELE|nr:hypothetical protein AAFF_G00417260 [Aldrovandia affinis]
MNQEENLQKKEEDMIAARRRQRRRRLQKVNDRSVSGMMSTVTASFQRHQRSRAQQHGQMSRWDDGAGDLVRETKRTLQTLLVRTASLLLWALLSTVLWHKISENYAPACPE